MLAPWKKKYDKPRQCIKKQIHYFTNKDLYSQIYVFLFIGRTDAEAETPILWPPDAKSQLIGKDPDAGED